MTRKAKAAAPRARAGPTTRPTVPDEEPTISRELFDKAMSAILAVPWDAKKWKERRKKKKRRVAKR